MDVDIDVDIDSIDQDIDSIDQDIDTISYMDITCRRASPATTNGGSRPSSDRPRCSVPLHPSAPVFPAARGGKMGVS